MHDNEKVAIARGFFVRLCLRHWQAYAEKQSKFRTIITTHYCKMSLMHWSKITHNLKLAESVGYRLTRSFYRKGWLKFKSNWLHSKALRIMQLVSGNTQKLFYKLWCDYVNDNKKKWIKCGDHFNANNVRRCYKRWLHVIRVVKVFNSALYRIENSLLYKGFSTWRYNADWIAFSLKFAGTAVERCVKKAYLRWCCSRWYAKTVKRRWLRSVVMRVLVRTKLGLLLVGFDGLRIKNKKKKSKGWEPRSLGFCTCVYSLRHGGHCRCSFELHFHKRLLNFGNALTISQDILEEQFSTEEVFEKDYNSGLRASVGVEGGLRKSYDRSDGSDNGSTKLVDVSDVDISVDEFVDTVNINAVRQERREREKITYDMNGRRVVDKKSSKRRSGSPLRRSVTRSGVTRQSGSSKSPGSVRGSSRSSRSSRSQQPAAVVSTVPQPTRLGRGLSVFDQEDNNSVSTNDTGKLSRSSSSVGRGGGRVVGSRGVTLSEVDKYFNSFRNISS
jgi:hypothetical protein